MFLEPRSFMTSRRSMQGETTESERVTAVARLDREVLVPTRPDVVLAWDAIVRAHNHRVVVMLLAMGLGIDRAKEIAQATWLRLFEQERAGKLKDPAFPGIALAQARYLALDQLRRERNEAQRFLDVDV